MKKLLVTGGAGFIGSEFVRQGVRKGYEIAVVDKLTYAGDLERIAGVQTDIYFYQADIINREFLSFVFKSQKPDAVIHLAAESHVDRSILDASPFLETNVKGTQILLETAREYGIERFLNISTDEVYGELKDEGQFDEASPLNPNSPYSVSKASADMLGRAYHRTYALPVITIRPCNNYGPWQYPEKLIPLTITKATNDEKIPIYGEGLNVREWLFVSDCAEALFQILERGSIGEVYNIGSGEEKRNIDVVKDILQWLGKPETLMHFTKDRLGHDFRYSLRSEKTRKQLGWTPRTHFAEGLEETVKWYLAQRSWTSGTLHPH
jgi:dTDP-glucose 4,6-dehydratase